MNVWECGSQGLKRNKVRAEPRIRKYKELVHKYHMWVTYTMAAQDLVMRARGVLKDRGWRISDDRLGSGDDISVYIIPLMYGNQQD
uniref:Uncharacterized protein n=1 Tax=Knipowitschia caucasica TaxID=637954 RepID=A0AAV2ITH9_KNICA